jgi:hypothetical protein
MANSFYDLKKICYMNVDALKLSPPDTSFFV